MILNPQRRFEMKYKIEVTAESVKELLMKTKMAINDLSLDSCLIKELEEKHYASAHPMKFANVLTLPDYDQEEDFLL